MRLHHLPSSTNALRPLLCHLLPGIYQLTSKALIPASINQNLLLLFKAAYPQFATAGPALISEPSNNFGPPGVPDAAPPPTNHSSGRQQQQQQSGRKHRSQQTKSQQQQEQQQQGPGHPGDVGGTPAVVRSRRRTTEDGGGSRDSEAYPGRSSSR